MGGVNNAAMQAQLRLTIRDMAAQMDKSCANFAILIEKYAESCKGLVEHPDQRYLEIIRSYEKRQH
jgi:hypothetical protein